MRYEEVAEYVEGLVGEGDELLASVRKKSSELRALGVYSIDPSRGRLLELLARIRSAERVLEIGSGAGYSAMWFIKGMSQDGTLDAIEHNPEVCRGSRSCHKRSAAGKTRCDSLWRRVSDLEENGGPVRSHLHRCQER